MLTRLIVVTYAWMVEAVLWVAVAVAAVAGYQITVPVMSSFGVTPTSELTWQILGAMLLPLFTLLVLAILAGPCVVENREMILHTAERLKNISVKLNIPFVFKSSYKKANRTSMTGFIGIGMDEALKILEEVKKQFELPILTDVHTS